MRAAAPRCCSRIQHPPESLQGAERTRYSLDMKKRLLGLIAALGMVLATFVATPSASAATAVSGTVMCVSQASVVGVWIQAENGGSGWATLSGSANFKKTYKYTLPKNGRYQVHVGCGGTPTKWKTSNKSAYVSGGKNFTCIDFKYPPLPRSAGSVYSSSFYLKCVVA